MTTLRLQLSTLIPDYQIIYILVNVELSLSRAKPRSVTLTLCRAIIFIRAVSYLTS